MNSTRNTHDYTALIAFMVSGKVKFRAMLSKMEETTNIAGIQINGINHNELFYQWMRWE